MNIYLLLFLTFLKIGAVSFGGGYGMIALLEEEVIGHGWLTEGEFLNFIAVAESTPGPIAVNMATFIGASQAGVLGGLVATFGAILPVFIIMLVIASILKNFMKYRFVNVMLETIQPIVTALIVATGLFLLSKGLFNVKTINDTFSFDWKSLVILVIVSTIGISFKKIKKKSISPIILIVIAAALGLVVNLIFQ